MSTINQVTLQWQKTTPGSVKIKSLWLVKRDGTKETCDPSVYWGCYMSEVNTTGIATVTADAPTDDRIYNLQGMRVNLPQKGIYIKGGKKYVK